MFMLLNHITVIRYAVDFDINSLETCNALTHKMFNAWYNFNNNQ